MPVHSVFFWIPMSYDGLIVGLGNPGAKYARTRHNYGFMLVDRLVEHWSREPGASCEMRSGKVKADVWEIRENYGARQWLVLKPQTFMNLSGEAVSPLLRKTGITPERVLVLHDELDLSLGTVRFKFGGGLAGHNGLKSIAAHLGTRDFARMRLGIGRPVAAEMASYVLQSFSPDDQPVLERSLDQACDAVLDFCASGLAEATSRLHTR